MLGLGCRKRLVVGKLPHRRFPFVDNDYGLINMFRSLINSGLVLAKKARIVLQVFGT